MRYQYLMVIAISTCANVAHAVEIVSTGKVGSNGDAYSGDRESFVGSRCVTGTAEPIGVASASLSLDQSMSQKQAESDLGFSIGGRARYGVVEGSASANFLSRSVSNDFSIAAIYSATYSFQTEKLSAPALSDIGRRVSGNPERWRTTCGSGYISEVKKGAKFFFSIKIDFKSREEKQAFSAKFDVSGPAAGVNGSLQRASAEFSKRTKVTVSVLQVGGDVDKVSGIFGNAAAGRADYVECTLGAFEACSRVLQTALTYATDTATGFPSQLTSSNKRADLSYVVSNYEAAGIYEAPPPFFDQIVSMKRARLAQQFEAQYEMATKLASLRNVNATPPRSIQLDTAQKAVDANMRAIYAAGTVCYDTPRLCADTVDALKLAAVGDEVFEVPSFESLCLDAFGSKDSTQRDFVLALAVVDGRLRKESRNIRVVDVCGGSDDMTNMIRFANFSNIIDLSEKNVRERTGIRYRFSDVSILQAGFDKIEQLNLSGHDITKLDAVGLLNKLGILNLSGNRIVDIAPLGDLRRLELLDISNNDIRDPSALSGLTRLSLLNLAGNHISDASNLKDLPKLALLDLSGNQLTKVDGLLQLGSQMSLNLSKNKISTLAGATASGPVSIDISDNPIPPQEVFEFCERNPKVKVSLTALPGTYGRFTLSSLNGARPNIVQSYTCNSR